MPPLPYVGTRRYNSVRAPVPALRTPHSAPSMTDPIASFAELFERILQSDLREPTAVTLATADADGRPAARMVLLKHFDSRGFVFFTNLESRKARDLAANPRAALCFYWPLMEMQVRVEGPVSPVDEEEADEYFGSRPRGSQIGAWASLQSRPLPRREELEERVREMEERFADRSIPRPPFWSGFRVAPERIEFWYGRPSRLHDREVFTATEQGWSLQRLYP